VEILGWILFSVGIVLTCLTVWRGRRAGDSAKTIFDEAIETGIISILALSFILPGRVGVGIAIAAGMLMSVRSLAVRRHKTRARS
jgi:uncharacterized membrane protein